MNNDNRLIQQMLSERLDSLEELRMEWIGHPQPPYVCTTCYLIEADCWCTEDKAQYWPLPQAVYILRAELNLTKDGIASGT